MSTPLFMKKNIFEKEMVPIIQAMSGTYKQDGGASMGAFSIQLTDVINKIIDDKTCINTIITFNNDKLLFGVYVNPTLVDTDLNKIIFSPEPVELTRYSLEIDTKLFDLLTAPEIAAYIIEDITTTMSPVTIRNVRALMETIMTDQDLSINVRQSVNFSQLLIFGIKDTIRKVSSLLYKPSDEDGVNEYASEFDYAGAMPYIAEKIHTNIKDTTNIDLNPKLSVLSWVLSTYNDPEMSYEIMLDTLNDAMATTGSKTEIDEIKKTITALERAVNETLVEATIQQMHEGMSIFKNLKMNGLRSIEDDLYEYKIRVKTCETEDDAMYILHQISTRINILEDYLYNTQDLSDSEIKRWTNVIVAYKNLRYELGKKPVVDKKRYGIYVDYDAIDKLENENANVNGDQVLDESFFHSPLKNWIPKLEKIYDESPDSTTTPKEVKRYVDQHYSEIMKLCQDVEDYPKTVRPDVIHRLAVCIASLLAACLAPAGPFIYIGLLASLVGSLITLAGNFMTISENYQVVYDLNSVKGSLQEATRNKKVSPKDRKRIQEMIDRIDQVLGYNQIF